jgi:hypothetical protein
MVDRPALTTRNITQRSYVPEQDPNWVKGQELIGKQALYNNLYEDFLRKSGSPEVARANADRIMRTMERQEITGAVQGAAPFLARGAEGAAGLASRFMKNRPPLNRSISGEVLPPVQLRNAKTPDEMLTVEAPKPVVPEAPKPVVPEAPPAKDVRGTPFRDEGMVDPESIIQARVAQAEREAAEQAAAMDRMLSEGGVGPTNQRVAQQAANDREITQRALEMTRLEGEGGITADTVAAAKKAHNDRIAAEQARREAEIARFEDEGGGMAHTRVPPSYSTDFVMGETMPMTHGIPQGRPYTPGDFRRFGLPAPSTGTNLVAGASAPRQIELGGLGAAGAFGLGKEGFNYLYPVTPQAPSASTLPDAVVPAPSETTEPTKIGGDYNDVFNVPYTSQGGDYNDVFNVQYNPPAKTGSSSGRSQGSASSTEKQSTGPDVRALWEAYNKSGEAADFVRADRAAKESGMYEGKKAGGSVEKKPDAVHKALEIIHHLVMR